MLEERLLTHLTALLPDVLAEYRAWQAGSRLAARPAGRLPADPAALAHAMSLLARDGQAEALRTLKSRLRAAGEQPEALLRAAGERSQALAAGTGAAIAALRTLPRLDWDRTAERTCAACQTLRRHPGFGRMDAAGRALYLSAVSRISRRTGMGEAKSFVCGKIVKWRRSCARPGSARLSRSRFATSRE